MERLEKYWGVLSNAKFEELCKRLPKTHIPFRKEPKRNICDVGLIALGSYLVAIVGCITEFLLLFTLFVGDRFPYLFDGAGSRRSRCKCRIGIRWSIAERWFRVMLRLGMLLLLVLEVL
jgi:hypothetical protein